MANSNKKNKHSGNSKSTKQSTPAVSNTTNVAVSVVVANKNSVQSKDQQRAKHALEAIEELKNQMEHSKVKSAVSGLPAMIHMNGLGHAFAFFLSDAKNFPEREAIVKIVSHWLENGGQVFNHNTDNSNSNKDKVAILKTITQADMTTYQIAQQEAQAYLLWLKKFARALLTTSD